MSDLPNDPAVTTTDREPARPTATKRPHKRRSPCAVCGGYDEGPRHKGVRCAGFTTGTAVYCTREEHAGGLPITASTSPPSYRHPFGGTCGCGLEHEPRRAAVRNGRGVGLVQVAAYAYHDPDGALLFEAVRFVDPNGGKTFRLQRPDGNGGRTWGMGDTPHVLYRLHELGAADPGGFVFVVEGEKDADTLARHGLVATANPMGAGKWRPELHVPPLEGRNVVVLQDEDEVGRAHAQAVLRSLHGKTASLRLVVLPGIEKYGKGADVSEWLAAGHTVKELGLAVAAAPEWTPPPEAAGGDGAAVRLTPAPAPVPSWNRTDAGNAEMFAEMFGDRVRFDHARKRCLLWAVHFWKPDADAEVQRLALLVARERLRRAADIEDADERKAAVNHARASEHRSRLDAMLAVAQSMRPIADAGKDWDADPFLLGVPNGVVDLRTGELRPGRQDDRITMQAGAAFDPQATCPRWLAFLAEVFGENEELLAFVQRVAGYSLTADTTEQVWFGCYGSGANGKTTFLEALRRVAGDYGCNAAFSAFEMHARAAIPQDVARLVGRRLVTASETNEGARLNGARIKALSGGDRLTARRMYENDFEFDPTLKLWLSFNHRPAVGDDSPAFWRRVRLIPFERTIPEERRDNRLGEKLRGERAGILAWMVRGCLDWYKRSQAGDGATGLGLPAAVRGATDAYREESDPLGAFLADECVLEPAARATSAELWTRYQEYTRGDATALRTRRAFTDRLRAHGFEPDRVHSGRGWIGGRLRHGEELL